jgi:hypothetical protein
MESRRSSKLLTRRWQAVPPINLAEAAILDSFYGAVDPQSRGRIDHLLLEVANALEPLRGRAAFSGQPHNRRSESAGEVHFIQQDSRTKLLG